MVHARIPVLAPWLILLVARIAFGQDVASKGELAVESRAFRDDGNSATKDHALGLFGRLEALHEHGLFEEKARVFGRMDHYDKNRSVLVAEELWMQVQGARLRVRAGADIVNWTATEAFHPVDVINSRNLDSDLENFEKVGEPMLSITWRVLDQTTITALALPYRTASIFPSPSSRLNFVPAGIDVRDRRLMVDRNGHLTADRFGPQGALLVRQVVGSADISLHFVEHIDRSQPSAVANPLAASPAEALPYLLFQTVRQVGGTYQQVLGSLIVKVEGAYRRFAGADSNITARFGPQRSRNHGTIAAGLEYGLPHAGGSESTLIAEGQAVLGTGKATRASLSPFQRDVLCGYRFAFNDEGSKEFMLAAIFDLERHDEYMVSASYSQRLGETWTVRAGLRLFQADQHPLPTGLAAFRQSDHVRLILTRYF